VASLDGQVVEIQSAPLAATHPFVGASEQNFSDWCAATIAAVFSLSRQSRSQCRGIGLSGQIHDAVLLDTAKRPITPAILWNDSRATVEWDDILRAVP